MEKIMVLLGFIVVALIAAGAVYVFIILGCNKKESLFLKLYIFVVFLLMVILTVGFFLFPPEPLCREIAYAIMIGMTMGATKAIITKRREGSQCFVSVCVTVRQMKNP